MDKLIIQQAIDRFEQAINNSLNIRAVFFDMDGVLFDSMPNHAFAWVSAFKMFGIEMTIEEAYMYEGSTALNTAREMFRKYRDQEISEQKAEEIRMCKHELMDSLPPSGIISKMPFLVKSLAQQGIDRWVVTGSAQNVIIERLDKEYQGYFSRDKMVTAHDVKFGKPHPEPYLMALEKSGLERNEAIVIENAPLGIISSKAAGLFTIAINTGPLNPSVLTDAGADLLFESSESLYQNWPVLMKCLKLRQDHLY